MKNILEKIIELELEMFLAVPADGTYSCQEDPEGFRLHRRAQFSIWSEDTLQSYLDDLYRAKKKAINLMTIKYARMDDLLPAENSNPQIEEIVTHPKPLADRNDSEVSLSYGGCPPSVRKPMARRTAHPLRPISEESLRPIPTKPSRCCIAT